MRSVILFAAAVFLTAARLFACSAVEKNGKKCTRNPCSGSQYCWLHGGTDKAAQASGKAKSDAAKVRCKAKSKSGASCRQMAVVGSEYCPKHAKEAGDKAKAAEDRGGAVTEKKSTREVEAVTSASPKAR